MGQQFGIAVPGDAMAKCAAYGHAAEADIGRRHLPSGDMRESSAKKCGPGQMRRLTGTAGARDP